MAKSQIPPDISSLSFESSLAELEEIVRQLEQGKSNLEEAISAYERGAALKKNCEKKLNEAKVRIEKIRLGEDDKEILGLEKLDP